MKKIILFFTAVAFTGAIQNVHAQNAFKSADAAVAEAESIIRSFSGSKDADTVSIGSFLISIVRSFVGDQEAKQVLKMAKGLLVVDLEDCSADVKRCFTLRMGKFIDSLGEFKLMETRDDEDNMLIIGDESKISGMLVCSSDCEAVLIKLSAKPADIGKLMQSAK